MYKINFGLDGVAKSELYNVESEAEAIEAWEWYWCEQEFDVEFVSCVEVAE